MIPLGVYTHINFAFASINPTTFEVVPGDPGDVDLYQQVTLLKGQQPDLKVFIAIGGQSNSRSKYALIFLVSGAVARNVPNTPRTFIYALQSF